MRRKRAEHHERLTHPLIREDGVPRRATWDEREALTRDESRQTQTTTICSYCGVGCGLTPHVRDNRIVKVTSPHDNPVTHGNLCVKGRFGFQHVRNVAQGVAAREAPA